MQSRRRPYAARLRPAERRDQLLDAALQIIVRDGYRAVSVDAIAKFVGVTRPVVYNVFTDLRELLLALLDRQEQRALTSLLGTVGQLDGDVEPTIRALIDMVRNDPDTWRPIFATFADAPPAVRARIDHDRELVRKQFQVLLEQAKLRPGADAAIMAHALVAMGEYFGRMLVTDPDAIDVDALTGTVVAMLMGVADGGRASGTRGAFR